MLQTYLKEWADALKNAVILEERKDENGVLQFQKSEIRFHGVAIEIRNTRIPGAVAPAQEFRAEFYIPSTITIIREFQSSECPKTEFIATILEAIDPNFEQTYKDTLMERREALEKFYGAKQDEWRKILSGSKYTEEDITFLLDFAKSRIKYERVDNIALFLTTMAKYQDKILNEEVVLQTSNGDVTRMDILFDHLCRCCSKRTLAEKGKYTVARQGAENTFLHEDNDHKAAEFNVFARVLLRDIYKDCKGICGIFTVVAYGLASFCAHRFNETISYRLAKVSERKMFKKNKENNFTIGDALDIDEIIKNLPPPPEKQRRRRRK